MAKLVDALLFATYETDLKAYLGITGTSEDTWLSRWWNAACVDGDRYLGEPFTDADGNDLPIPEGVVQGVYEWVRMMRSFYVSAASPGVASVKTGDLSQNFTTNAANGIQPGKQAMAAAIPFWSPYRERGWR